jgi:hypothetical protein
MIRRDWLSWLLAALATVCFVAGLAPQGSRSIDASGDKVTQVQLGLWFSPFFRYVYRAQANGFETQGGINWISWSSVALLVAIISLRIRRRRRAAHASQPEASAGEVACPEHARPEHARPEHEREARGEAPTTSAS